MPRVLITDFAWPDVEIERAILSDVGAELVVAEATDEPALAAAARDADAIMTNWAKVTAAVIDTADRCRIVARLGIGLDNIDVARATERGMLVTNVPDYCQTEVAEHALALLLALARNVSIFHHDAKNRKYDLQVGPTLRRVEGRTLGVIGLGAIGNKLSQKAQAIGLNVIATSRSQTGVVDGARIVPLDELLETSDFVSLSVPLTPETKHMINAQTLAQMKPTAFLINTARGGLVDEAALSDALERGALAGAALDVQATEPPDLSQSPFNHPNVIVTPHAAFYSVESVTELRQRAAKQVADVLEGKTPENVVNAE